MIFAERKFSARRFSVITFDHKLDEERIEMDICSKCILPVERAIRFVKKAGA